MTSWLWECENTSSMVGSLSEVLAKQIASPIPANQNHPSPYSERASSNESAEEKIQTFTGVLFAFCVLFVRTETRDQSVSSALSNRGSL